MDNEKKMKRTVQLFRNVAAEAMPGVFKRLRLVDDDFKRNKKIAMQ